jgi:hypothetical protein
VQSAQEVEDIAVRLLDGTTKPRDQFRLLGVSCTKLLSGEGTQGVLWSLHDLYDPPEREGAVAALDDEA